MADAHTIQATVQGATLEGILNRVSVGKWADSLVNGTEYKDPDPNYLARLLVMQTLSAESIAAVFETGGVEKLQTVIPDRPDASTGLILMDDIYVTGSDFGDGAPVYMILGWTSVETGERRRVTTGAQQLQAQCCSMLRLGFFPFKCCIKRIDRKDRGGRYLFQMFPSV